MQLCDVFVCVCQQLTDQQLMDQQYRIRVDTSSSWFMGVGGGFMVVLFMWYFLLPST